MGQAPQGKTLPQYRQEDVYAHRKRGDLWMTIHGKVYDLSSFLDQHPGSPRVLLDVGGEDASDEFDAADHSPLALEQMQQFLIGELITDHEEKKTNTSALNTSSSPLPNSTAAATSSQALSGDDVKANQDKRRVLILYASQRGTAATLAKQITEFIHTLNLTEINSNNFSGFNCEVKTMNEFEPEDLCDEGLVVFVTSSHTDGAAPTNGQLMCKWLNDASKDFRVSKTYLNKTRFTVFGLGDSLYEENYNKTAKLLENWVNKLGAHLFCLPGVADNNASRSDGKLLVDDVKTWCLNVLSPALLAPELDEPLSSLVRTSKLGLLGLSGLLGLLGTNKLCVCMCVVCAVCV